MQSAYDTDATYRDKAGKKASGYTATFTETGTDENIVQIIVDYTVEPNNKSDVEIIENRMDIIKDNTGAKRLRVRGKIKCTLQIGFKVIGHNFKQIFRALTDQIKKPKIKTKGLLCPNPS